MCQHPMLRQDVFFAERTLSEKIGILLHKTVTEMYSHTPKRVMFTSVYSFKTELSDFDTILI